MMAGEGPGAEVATSATGGIDTTATSLRPFTLPAPQPEANGIGLKVSGGGTVRTDVISDFRVAMQAAGLSPPEIIEADGILHRFSSNGRRGDDAGWYVLHPDGIPAGAFGDWRTGLKKNWYADLGRVLTDAERKQRRQCMAAVKRERERERAESEQHAEAAERAAREWEAAAPATAEHPYLASKGVQAHGLRVDAEGRLLVPVRSGRGAWQSLLRIPPDGEKK